LHSDELGFVTSLASSGPLFRTFYRPFFLSDFCQNRLFSIGSFEETASPLAYTCVRFFRASSLLFFFVCVEREPPHVPPPLPAHYDGFRLDSESCRSPGFYLPSTRTPLFLLFVLFSRLASSALVKLFTKPRNLFHVSPPTWMFFFSAPFSLSTQVNSER